MDVPICQCCPSYRKKSIISKLGKIKSCVIKSSRYTQTTLSTSHRIASFSISLDKQIKTCVTMESWPTDIVKLYSKTCLKWPIKNT